MRKPSELKFHPIKFHNCGINGSAGTKSPDEFFRSALSQNICYCVRNTAKTINEIADDLGVSPVYVETEVEFLEEYGFLLAQKGRYIINFLISEPTAQLLTMQNEMYRKAAELYANDLYDALIVSGIPELEGIRCCQSDKAVSLTESAKADRNFLLWALIPYIVARAGETMMNNQISFEEVATLRPDGGHNIYHATVLPGELILPDDYVYMKNWCGPMWNCVGDRMLWQVDSQWCDRKTQPGPGFAEDSRRILSLYLREQEERLSRDEYAWLAERGVIKTNGDYDGFFKAAWQIVVLADRETQEKLLSIGEVVKLKHFGTFEKLKKPYVEAVLESVPAHLRKLRAYELQYLFHSDGWFLLHCIRVLLDNGKLKEPTPGQRKALSTIMVYT